MQDRLKIGQGVIDYAAMIGSFKHKGLREFFETIASEESRRYCSFACVIGLT
jgi:hypothetical protein